ncbi:MAG: FUSC family protein, partial [Parahaliea sp.]
EFAGAYVAGGTFSLAVFALLFPFDPAGRIARLFQQTRLDIGDIVASRPSPAQQLALESRMLDRLSIMMDLLTATTDTRSRALFQCNLMGIGLASTLGQLSSQCDAAPAIPEPVRQQLHRLVEDIADYVSGRRQLELAQVKRMASEVGESLDEGYQTNLERGRGNVRQLFRLRAALAITINLLGPFQALLEAGQEHPVEGEPDVA